MLTNIIFILIALILLFVLYLAVKAITRGVEAKNDLNSNNGTYAWAVPNTPSDNCLIKVVDINNGEIVSISETTFEILEADSFIEVTYPNENNQFNTPLLLYTSSSPFQINGWKIGEKDNKIEVKILKILEFNKKNIDSNIFLLSEKNRNEGKVWFSPFGKKTIIRDPKYRN